MSHSSGITVSADLNAKFGAAKASDSTRLFKILIVNETEAVVAETVSTNGSWQEDFSRISPLLKETEACFIVYRLDSNSQLGYEWVLMSYVPDKAKVREKMVYSSTKATLKLQLGGGLFVQEIFGTVPKDFTLESYNKYIASQQAEAPLTRAEMDRKEEEETGGVFVGGQGTGAIPGVQFPVEENVIASLKKLKEGSINYVQLIIDPNRERIILGGAKKISLGEFPDQVPIDEPRFHFYNWSHQHDGANVDSLVYIYSSPDGSEGTKSAPVKLRMLYSSSKANVTNIAQSVNLEIATRFEVNRGNEINETTLTNQIHPPPVQVNKGFAKPKGPGKGPARLVKGN